MKVEKYGTTKQRGGGGILREWEKSLTKSGRGSGCTKGKRLDATYNYRNRKVGIHSDGGQVLGIIQIPRKLGGIFSERVSRGLKRRPQIPPLLKLLQLLSPKGLTVNARRGEFGLRDFESQWWNLPTSLSHQNIKTFSNFIVSPFPISVSRVKKLIIKGIS